MLHPISMIRQPLRKLSPKQKLIAKLNPHWRKMPSQRAEGVKHPQLNLKLKLSLINGSSERGKPKDCLPNGRINKIGADRRGPADYWANTRRKRGRWWETTLEGSVDVIGRYQDLLGVIGDAECQRNVLTKRWESDDGKPVQRLIVLPRS